MGKIRIITDSVSDISYELEKKYDVDIIPFPVVIGDKSYMSRVDFDNDGFYRLMEQYDEIPKTSQITSFQFEELYYEYYEKGYSDIVLILINSGGSATYNNSVMAIDSFFEEHPECEGKISIHTFDGGNYSGGYGHPALVAGQMVQEGANVDDITAYLADEIPRRRIYFGMYSLKYAGKSGRIPSAAAFVGDKLGIKPIMKIWDHEITTASKCRGDKKLVAKVVDLAVKDMEPGSDYQLVCGKNVENLDEIQKKMTEKMGYGPTETYQIGAAVAANAGPEVIGVIFSVKK